eukprot:gene31184-9229_t
MLLQGWWWVRGKDGLSLLPPARLTLRDPPPEPPLKRRRPGIGVPCNSSSSSMSATSSLFARAVRVKRDAAAVRAVC